MGLAARAHLRRPPGHLPPLRRTNAMGRGGDEPRGHHAVAPRARAWTKGAAFTTSGAVAADAGVGVRGRVRKRRGASRISRQSRALCAVRLAALNCGACERPKGNFRPGEP
jgi:hypothetical protein